MKKIFAMTAAAALLGATGAASAQTVNVICSVQAEWCNMIATVYVRCVASFVLATNNFGNLAGDTA